MIGLQLVEFIRHNSDWEQLLLSEPYSLRIQYDEGFIMFMYSQFASDLMQPLVRECRGIILDQYFRPVCVPFYKFGNYGEAYAEEIDWTSARVQEKLDGSFIKLWFYDEEWRVSTNGRIDARKAHIGDDECYDSFFDLFMEAARISGLELSRLNPDCTYMFELTSPHNRVVVQYDETRIWHIGTRHNGSLQELETDIGVAKPQTYPLSSLEECRQAAERLPYSQEGYVVVDAAWRRVKIKSPAYVEVHHLSMNGVMTEERMIHLIRENETAEFLSYFPRFRSDFDDMRARIDRLIEDMDAAIEAVRGRVFADRKEFAAYANATPYAKFLFAVRDERVASTKEWLWSLRDSQIVCLLDRE